MSAFPTTDVWGQHSSQSSAPPLPSPRPGWAHSGHAAVRQRLKVISHGLLGLRLLLPGGTFLPVQLHSPSLMVLWPFSRPSASLEGSPEPGGTLLLVSPLVNVSTFPAINSHMCGHFRRFLSFHPPDSLGRNRVHHLTVQVLAREERACPGSSEVALLGLHCVQPSSVPVSSLCCAG